MTAGIADPDMVAAAAAQGKIDMANKDKDDLSRWSIVAQTMSPDEQPANTLPLHVLLGEAVDVAKFFERHWKTQVDGEGRVTRLGLETAVPKDKKKGSAALLSAKTGAEILSLQRATQEAHTRYLLTVEQSKSPRPRGELLLGEMRATLRWYFDDGVDDDKDEMLARLDAQHGDNPGSLDALASALDDYAHLADRHRKALDGLGGFEAAHIDEAREVAATLRARPAQADVLSEQAREAITLRNRLAALLAHRMGLVRGAARFVFRKQPEIVREVTSAYERKRRSASRRKEKEAPAPQAPAAPAGG
jgi:hypothetical protein